MKLDISLNCQCLSLFGEGKKIPFLKNPSKEILDGTSKSGESTFDFIRYLDEPHPVAKNYPDFFSQYLDL